MSYFLPDLIHVLANNFFFVFVDCTNVIIPIREGLLSPVYARESWLLYILTARYIHRRSHQINKVTGIALIVASRYCR